MKHLFMGCKDEVGVSFFFDLFLSCFLLEKEEAEEDVDIQYECYHHGEQVFQIVLDLDEGCRHSG